MKRDIGRQSIKTSDREFLEVNKIFAKVLQAFPKELEPRMNIDGDILEMRLIL